MLGSAGPFCDCFMRNVTVTGLWPPLRDKTPHFIGVAESAPTHARRSKIPSPGGPDGLLEGSYESP